jgi:hypothetical protein
VIKKKLETVRNRTVFLSLADMAELGNVEKVVVTAKGKEILIFTEDEYIDQSREKLSGLTGLDLKRKQRALFSSGFLQNINKRRRVRIPSIIIRGGV